MAETLEERVAYLEGKVEELSRLGSDVRERLGQLDQKIDRFRNELAAANAATNSRIDATNSRIDALEQRLSSRFDALDQKLSTQFRWLVGIMFAVLLAVIGVLLRFAPS